MPDPEGLAAFEALCRRHGLPITVQRRVIYEFVSAREDHPTADQVYDGVQHRIPGVSRTTVYRVLAKLVSIGALKRVCSPGPTARFDAKVTRHHHLVCTHCEKLVDYVDEGLDDLPIPKARARGFEIDDYSIQFSGICADCRKKARESAGRKRG